MFAGSTELCNDSLHDCLRGQHPACIAGSSALGCELTWQTTDELKQLPASGQPDLAQLAELDGVRSRLAERVSQRAAEIDRGPTARP